MVLDVLGVLLLTASGFGEVQVDVALRGIPVTPGRHTVELEFRDPHVTYGAWGSATGLAILVGLLVATRNRRHGAPPEEAEA